MSYSWKKSEEYEHIFDYTHDTEPFMARIELAMGDGGWTARLIREPGDTANGEPREDFREAFMSLMEAYPNPPFSEARMIIDAAASIWPVLREAYKEELEAPARA